MTATSCPIVFLRDSWEKTGRFKSEKDNEMNKNILAYFIRSLIPENGSDRRIVRIFNSSHDFTADRSFHPLSVGLLSLVYMEPRLYDKSNRDGNHNIKLVGEPAKELNDDSSCPLFASFLKTESIYPIIFSRAQKDGSHQK